MDFLLKVSCASPDWFWKQTCSQPFSDRSQEKRLGIFAFVRNYTVGSTEVLATDCGKQSVIHALVAMDNHGTGFGDERLNGIAIDV